MNKERLINVARALRESPNPDQFDMSFYGYDCGTPACAWGHYCARPDLQTEFRLDRDGTPETVDGSDADISESVVDEHFGIRAMQVVELFGSYGCGNAKTATEAAEYIERFVERGGKS